MASSARRSGWHVGPALVAALLAPRAASAVSLLAGEETLAFDRTEAWALKYFGSVSLLTGFGVPRPTSLGDLALGFEADWVPELDQVQRTVGFNGTKEEALNQLPVFVRPRLTIGLIEDLSLTLTYLPPIPVAGVESNLFAAGLGRPIVVAGAFRIGARVYGQVGWVRAGVTCSQRAVVAGSDPVRNPLGCLEKSKDKALLRYIGADAGAAYEIRSLHHLEPYVTVAVNYFDLGLQVRARYGDVVDSTTQTTSGVTFSTAVGLALPITGGLHVAAEVFYSPLTVSRPQRPDERIDGFFNVRTMVEYRFDD